MKRLVPHLPHTLRGRLTAGLVVLLALACATVGLVSVLALERFLVGRLDQQLATEGPRFAVSLEQEPDGDGDEPADTRGQAAGTFGARLVDGRVERAAVVRGTTDRAVPLTSADAASLAALPTGGQARTLRLSTLGEYRVAAHTGRDGDVLVTGLPLHPVEETVERLVMVEAVGFAAVLAVAGTVAAVWTRLSLRPLEHLAATADGVTRLPLAAGQVDLPPPLAEPGADSEVGRLTGAFNRMLGHVGDALDRRHAVEERLRTFAADAGHELRTPVATVRARAELVLRTHGDALPDEVRHALQRIDSESRRMSLLVDELLLLARLDAGRALCADPVDLTRLVLDTVEDASTRHPEHHWEMELPERPVHVTGDADRLHQVLVNLLANAGRHTPAGTRVVVALVPRGTEVELSVTDDGPGIPPDLMPVVFRRFSRGDASRSRATGATGLGLAIVQAVVGAHGGRVSVASEPGRTCFTLVLPSDREAAEAGTQPSGN
ncbi:sensor histidine kinase [Streptomyces sp. NPDC059176]|uniref:sensor histidine kinase n=1 Tax=unclassified Streptomyces TaxID=2593676 RepID=UPI003689C155